MSLAHEELAALAPAYALGSLDADESLTFTRHLDQCGICAGEVSAYAQVVATLAHAAPEAEPRPILRARVIAAVEAAHASTHSEAPRRSTRVVIALLPYAALIAVTVGLGAYALTLRDNRQQVEQVLAATDLARIDLAGQTTAPAAHGRALWSRNRGMVFIASNMPPLPDGRVYQVWVVTASARISAGLLAPDAAGGGAVVFSTPRDIEPPVAVAVTIEPAGGVPQPTGAFYLLGTAGG
jgi:anti-sigma-K factor RskA